MDLEPLIAINSATAHPHLEPDGTVYNTGMMQKAGKHVVAKMTPALKGTF